MLEGLITSMPLYVCAFWSVVLLLDVLRTRQVAKLRLLIYMLAATVLYVGHFVFFNELKDILPLTDTIYCMANLVVFPLYYLYLRELTVPDKMEHLEWLWFVPTVTMGAIIGMLYALMSRNEVERFIDFYLYDSRFDLLSGLSWWQAIAHHAAKTLFALQIPPILWLGYRHIKQYDHRVDAFYADTDDKSLRQMKAVLYVFIIVAITSFTANVLGRERFFNSIWLLSVPSVAFSVLQFLLGYTGHRQNFSIVDLMADESREAYKLTPESDIEISLENSELFPLYDSLRDQFFSIIRDERLYLQPNLKISDLADRLETNRTYLQHILKEETGYTFTEFINRQRIDYACEQMALNPDRSVAEIGIESGFTSAASFYRNFKLYRHCSPTSYKPEAND